jgi:hypothetical protein
MGDWQLFFWIVGALIAFAGLIMAFARTPPNDAISNLSQWAQWAALYRLSGWLRYRRINQLADRWAKRAMIVLAFVASVGIIVYFSSKSRSTIEPVHLVRSSPPLPAPRVSSVDLAEEVTPLSPGDLHVEDTRLFEGTCKRLDGQPCIFNTGGFVAATIYQCCPSGSRCTAHPNGVAYCKRMQTDEPPTFRDHRHNFRGEISFNDGTTASYIWLWSDLAGSEIAWARNPSELNGKTSDLRYVRFSDISRIDFVDMTPAEKEAVTAAKLSAEALKAKITYLDHHFLDEVFLYAYYWKWEGYYESGSINSKVRSLTIQAAE